MLRGEAKVLATIDKSQTFVPAIDDLIAAVLRGGDVAWRAENGVAFVEAFLQRCDHHGVGALLHLRLKSKGDWPTIVREAVHQRALSQSMWELRHQHVLSHIISALSKCGVRPIIFKGTALAYTHYPHPSLRRRGDTDLIVAPADRAKAEDVLTALGLKPMAGISGQFISYQTTYTLDEPGSGHHDFDLHWRINNSELLSRLLSYDELRTHAEPVPHLCADALTAHPVHALLIASMHRKVHTQSPYYVNGTATFTGNRLIWLYDIHQLAHRFTQAHWHEVVNQAQRTGLCAVCLDGLQSARQAFQTPIPELISAALTRADEPERPATYLRSGNLRRAQMDFAEIDGLANKLRFVRELVLPPASYMQSKFPNASTVQLPWLYTRRAVGGVLKRLRPKQLTP